MWCVVFDALAWVVGRVIVPIRKLPNTVAKEATATDVDNARRPVLYRVYMYMWGAPMQSTWYASS